MADDTRPVFYYATGTAFSPAVVFEDGKLRLNYIGIGAEETNTFYVPGLNGKVAPFTGGVTNDPFPILMNSDLWEAVKVPYLASSFPMDQSIQGGVDWLINAINSLPAGRKWAVGGTSQGAAVASRIYKEVQTGTAFSTATKAAFLTGVCFGNPMRQVNYTNPWSSYSGAMDDPGSTTGGHGSFPASYRLTNCNQNNWIEFTNPAEVITGVGDTPAGMFWQAGNGLFLLQTLVTPGSPGSFTFNLITFLLGVGSALLAQGLPFLPSFIDVLNNASNPAAPGYWGPGPVTDAIGQVVQLPGGGHTTYAGTSPYGYAGPETSYQLALKYLDNLALQSAVSPSVLPPTSTVPGWSTTLLPPAA